MLSNMIQAAISAEKNATDLLAKTQQTCQENEKKYETEARLLLQNTEEEGRVRLREKITQHEAENSQKLSQQLEFLKQEESSFLDQHQDAIKNATDAVCEILSTPLYVKRGPL